MSQFWALVLGAFLSGLVGVSVFFIQRRVERKDRDQEVLFDFYQRLRTPLSIPERGIDGMMHSFGEHHRKWTELEGLTLLIRDKELRREIYLLVSRGPHNVRGAEAISKKIEKELDKKFFEQLQEEKEAELQAKIEKSSP